MSKSFQNLNQEPSATTSVAESKRDMEYHVKPKVSAKPHQDSFTELRQSLQNLSLKGTSPITFVDTSASLVELLEVLADQPIDPPSLYIDLEGVNLSRHGTVSILQVFVYPIDRIFLVNIQTLGADAFSLSAPDGLTLRSVLESPALPKVFFDVRTDSDTLFSHYQVELSGVHDIQLMEIAQRKFPKRYLNGLAKRIEHNASMTGSQRADWKAIKDAGRGLFAPEQVGSFEVFNIRPLPDEIIQKCAQDVQLSSQLWHKIITAEESIWRSHLKDGHLMMMTKIHLNGDDDESQESQENQENQG